MQAERSQIHRSSIVQVNIFQAVFYRFLARMPAKKQTRGASQGRSQTTGSGQGRRAASPSPPTTSQQEDIHQQEEGLQLEDTQTSPRSSSAASTASMHSQSQSKSKKQQRTKRSAFTLGKEEEEQMCEFLRENDILWDSKKTDYRRIDKKNRLWEEQAEKMGKTPDHLQGWFKSLRDTNTRLHKMKSGDGAPDLTEREVWIKESFSFLQTVVRHRPEPVNSLHPLLEPEPAFSRNEETISPAPSSPGPSSTASSTSSKKKKRGEEEDDDALLLSLQKKVHESGDLLKSLSHPQPITATAAFANYVRDSLVTMSKKKFKIARARINTILTSLMEEDSEEEEDLPTVLQPAQCRSAPPATNSTVTQSTSGIFQPPPSMWRHRPPPGSVCQSQSSAYMEEYYQQPMRPQFQQQSGPTYHTLMPPPPSAPSSTHQQPSLSSTVSAAHQLLDQSPPSVSSHSLSLPGISGISPMSVSGMSDFLSHSPALDSSIKETAAPATPESELNTPPLKKTT